MTLVLVFFGLSLIMELAAPYVPRRFDLLRAVIVAVASGLLCSIGIFLLAIAYNIFTIFICLISLYRLFNLLRLLKARIHPIYLRRVSLRTTCWLAGAQAELYLLRILWDLAAPSAPVLWMILAGMQCLMACIMLRTVLRHTRHASTPATVKAYTHGQLPTVTVAIAARNETEGLISCLQSVVASDYPKLEILVLDDCSQNRRTSEIIRSFAHDGVRFIPGAEPAAGWLARNQAYDTLAATANGTFIVFCSTSVRLQQDSLRKLISYALTKDKSMISVMPQALPSDAGLSGTIFMNLRAAWELLLPRRRMRRPPVGSTLWLVKRQELLKTGSFAAVSRMVAPEAYFARTFAGDDSYSFLPGGAFYGVTSDDQDHEDMARFVRTTYPALHRRPEMVAVVSLLLLVMGFLPFPLAILAVFVFKSLALATVSLITCCLLLLSYRQVLQLASGRTPLREIITFPLAVCVAVIMHQYSMYKYEFSEVIWKQRNICIPVMHVVPRLPKI